MILFAIVGALSLSSIESVPSDLVDNGAVLGALCIVTALVFITDILISSNQPKKHRNGTNMVTDPKLGMRLKNQLNSKKLLHLIDRIPFGQSISLTSLN